MMGRGTARVYNDNAISMLCKICGVLRYLNSPGIVYEDSEEVSSPLERDEEDAYLQHIYDKEFDENEVL